MFGKGKGIGGKEFVNKLFEELGRMQPSITDDTFQEFIALTITVIGGSY